MRFHREGKKHMIISSVILLPLALYFLCCCFCIMGISLAILLLALWVFIFSFFRMPVRDIKNVDDQCIYAPADGKVVVIEEVFDTEYFNEKRLLISVFMSPLNVHVNRVPTGGKVVYKKYHPGKYLVAWHPKASTENERMSVVINNEYGDVLVKQIAGALARRISNYAEVEHSVIQGEELGFIKFGSRVDLLLPLNTKVLVSLNQVVKGNIDVLAKF